MPQNEKNVRWFRSNGTFNFIVGNHEFHPLLGWHHQIAWLGAMVVSMFPSGLLSICILSTHDFSFSLRVVSFVYDSIDDIGM